MGREYADSINANLPLVEEAAVAGYVEGEGRDIARGTPRPDLPWEFRVPNTDAVNAFAVPGGFIYMNRGLLAASDGMAEVAGVLAHEVAHVVARHSVDQLERAYAAQMGLGIGSIIFGRPGDVAGAVINVTANMYFARHSRADEAEADSLAVGYMVDAGWHPRGLVSFFRTLLDMRESSPNALEALFASHPLTEDRIQAVQRIIDRIPPERLEGLRQSSPSYREMKAVLERLPPPPEEFRVEERGGGP